MDIKDIFIGNKIIIYGAGMVGNLTRLYCEITGVSDNIIAFAVSEKILPSSFWGYRFCCIDDLYEFKDKYKVLIATFPGAQETIEKRLRVVGFNDIIKMDFKMYRSMTNLYISNFLKSKKYANSYDILYIASDNNRTSGAFLCLMDLAKDIEKKGLNTLIVLPEYGNGEELLIEEGLDYTYVPSKSWLKKVDGRELTWQEKNEEDNNDAIAKIYNLIEQYKIKVVHCNTIYTYVGAVAAHNKGIPVVWHLREKISDQGYGYEDEDKFYGLINTSDRIITVSNYLKNCYPKLDPNKTVTVYDGIDVDKYYRKKDVLKNETVKIVMPGVIYPLKRQEDLICAAVMLYERGIQFHIDFIGADDDAYALDLKKKVYDKHLTDYVSFLGRKNDMENYYSYADIVVSCSGVESFGRIAIEASLAGCLVICANSGASAELFEDKITGMLFEYKNVYSLADVIEYAVKHPNEMRNIALDGQRKSKNLFIKENCSNKIFEIYKFIETAM